MNYLSKERKRNVIIVLFIYAAIIVSSIVMLVLRKPENLKAEYLLNAGVDMFGMIMGCVLFICCLIDVQRTGLRNLYFFYLINITMFGLYTDLIAWLVDGQPALNYINLVDNTLYYMTMPFAAIFFWLYVSSIFGEEDKNEKLLGRIMNAGLVISVVARILNLVFGYYFTVDSSGHYSRSAGYPVSMIYALFTTVATLYLIMKNRKKLQIYQLAALLIYIFMPFAVSVFTMFSYGLSFNFGVIMLVLLLMYCVINISQGRDKVISDRELKTAAVIQESVIPHIFPPFPHRSEFEIFATMDAAKDVGGDFYDFFLVDDDHLCLVIADVSGKGVPASLFMMVSKVLIKSHILAGESPGQALQNVNNILVEGNTTEMFVTVWIMEICISTGKAVVVNAGHENPILMRAGGNFELVKYRHSPAVATVEDIPFREHEFEMFPGDRVFVYTDGVPETINSSREYYGNDRLLEVLNKFKTEDTETLLKQVKSDVDTFMGEEAQFDDITMLGFRYNGV